MSALPAPLLLEPTSFEPQPKTPSAMQPDYKAVAELMHSRVERTLEPIRRYEPFEEALNPKGLSSSPVPYKETLKIQSRIAGAVAAAFPVPRVPNQLSLQPLQEWEGYVAEIGAETFTARLLDITAGQKYENEIADFPIADISDNDRDLLKPGAIFRWVIGYQRQIGGTKRRVSQITFRRLPAWSKRDIANAARRAEEISKSIDWQ